MEDLPEDLVVEITKFLDGFSVESLLCSVRVPYKDRIFQELNQRAVHLIHNLHPSERIPCYYRTDDNHILLKTQIHHGTELCLGTRHSKNIGISALRVHGVVDSVKFVVGYDLIDEWRGWEDSSEYPFKWLDDKHVLPLVKHAPVKVIIQSKEGSEFYTTYDLIHLKTLMHIQFGIWSNYYEALSKRKRIPLEGVVHSLRVIMGREVQGVHLLINGHYKIGLERKTATEFSIRFEKTLDFRFVECQVCWTGGNQHETVIVHAQYFKTLRIKHGLMGVDYFW